jgi:hypothetical protein
MEIRPLGAALIHADRQTDMTKLIGAFRDYANALRISRSELKLCVFWFSSSNGVSAANYL